MREPTYFLLLAVASEPLHGYAIARRAEELSAGRVKLSAGTLYGALDRLVDAGELVVDREVVVDGRKRRYYRMTPAGRASLAEASDRLRDTVTVAERVLGPGFGGATS